MVNKAPMFENIIGQQEIVEELKQDLRKNSLPRALLFHGAPLAGKLTTALELSRVLMCKNQTAGWNCDCQSCLANRTLENPYLLLIGPKAFLDEISAAANVLTRSPKDSSRYLFIRVVRKLTRRYDRAVWDGWESRISGYFPVLEELQDVLERLYPDQKSQIKSLGNLTSRAIKLCEKISGHASNDTIPVHHIRRATYWSHISAQESRKVVIVENADKMSGSAGNALLKVLEEPPRNTHFVLITTRKAAIIPTLRSRLRPFGFVERDEDSTRALLQRVFHEESSAYRTLREYFLAWQISPDSLRRECERFFEAVLKEDPTIFFMNAEAEEFLLNLKNRRIFTSFLEELSNLGKRLLDEYAKRGPISVSKLGRLEAWNVAIKKRAKLMESLNLNPRLLTESLYNEMRAAI